MAEPEPTSDAPAGEALPPEEEVMPVLASVRTLEPRRPGVLPARQAAAVAATSFVAGAATAAVLKRGRRTPSRRGRRKGRAKPLEVVGSRSFLVDVHLLGRGDG